MRKERIDLRSFLMPFPGYHSQLNSSLTDNGESFRFGYDSVNDRYGYYKEVAGADTFFPFSSGCVDELLIIYSLGNAYFRVLYYNGTDFVYYDSTYYTTLTSSLFEQFGFCKSASISHPRYDITFEEGYYSFIGFDAYALTRPNLTVTHLNENDVGSGYLNNWMAVVKYSKDPTQ